MREAMGREHSESQDSLIPFTAANYGTTTTPTVEYHFVTCPESGLSLLKLDAWPTESCLDAPLRRAPIPLLSFRAKLRELNHRLATVECLPVSEDELVSARLYTGPMFMKCATSRRASFAPVASTVALLCSRCSLLSPAHPWSQLLGVP